MKTDYLYALENIIPNKKLRRVILAVTNLCNSKCKTCAVWKNKERTEISLEELERFADTKLFHEIRFLAITGGEPFLRKDLVEIVNMLKTKNPKLHITILTNALLPEIIKEKASQMPKNVVFNLSFNGPEEIHDTTRGVKGNFKKLLQTIEILKSLGRNMSFIFTVTKENYDKLSWAWDFAKKNNINIMFSPEMDYGRLEHETGNRTLTREEINIVINQLNKIYSERKRGFFDKTYLLFFRKFYKKEIVSKDCYAGTNSLYIDYNGDIYPCENLVGRIVPFGNIKTGFIMPKDYKNTIKGTKCYDSCYLLCEMVRNIRRHPVKAMKEIKNNFSTYV